MADGQVFDYARFATDVTKTFQHPDASMAMAFGVNAIVWDGYVRAGLITQKNLLEILAEWTRRMTARFEIAAKVVEDAAVLDHEGSGGPISLVAFDPSRCVHDHDGQP